MMDLEARISEIEKRNARVGADKSWETSATRRGAIAVVTYLCAYIIFLFVTPHPHWYLAAMVPVMGYILSTLSLPKIRNLWEKDRL